MLWKVLAVPQPTELSYDFLFNLTFFSIPCTRKADHKKDSHSSAFFCSPSTFEINIFTLARYSKSMSAGVANMLNLKWNKNNGHLWWNDTSKIRKTSGLREKKDVYV